MTTEQILEVQRRAVERGDHDLLCAAYDALGVSRRYAFVPVSAWVRARGEEICAAELARTPVVP